MKDTIPNIDRLIQGIESITKNRCSLTDEDVTLLNECIQELQKFKELKKQNLEAEVYQETILRIIEMLIRFFVNSDSLPDWFDLFK